jgi:hypothetical protein
MPVQHQSRRRRWRIVHTAAFFQGGSDAVVVLFGEVIMVLLTPLMAYQLTRVFFLQVSATGLRKVVDWPGLRSVKATNPILTWNEMQRVHRWPGRIYTVRGSSNTGTITIAAWLIERPSELRNFAEEFASPEVTKQFLA